MIFSSAPGIRPWIGLLLTLFSAAAVAEVHNIDATFEPDFANPQKNQFKNQLEISV